MLHHPGEEGLELSDGAGHEGDLAEVAVLMQLPRLAGAAPEQIREVLMRVAGLVEDVGLLGRLEAQSAVVLDAEDVVQAHRAALLGEAGQLVDQQRELDGQFVVGVAEQADHAEERLRELGFLLEALEDAADADDLGPLGLGAVAVQVDGLPDEERRLLCDLAQTEHLARREARQEPLQLGHSAPLHRQTNPAFVAPHFPVLEDVALSLHKSLLL